MGAVFFPTCGQFLDYTNDKYFASQNLTFL